MRASATRAFAVALCVVGIGGCGDGRAPADSAEPARVRRVAISQFDGAKDAALEDLLRRLRVAVVGRDAAAIHAAVAEAFFIRRDFGGIFDPDASGVRNFASIYPLQDGGLGLRDPLVGWRKLAHDLQSPLAIEAGQACGPPLVSIEPDFDDERDWLRCFYVDGGAVPLRSAASPTASVVSTLDREVVRVVRPQETSLEEGERPDFIEVLRWNGDPGFVNSEYIRACTERRLCFARADGPGWQIAGVELAGD